ncbi:type I-D CRISPR-associated protein Cas10d/Csc3 [Microcystis aeruginosa KW]|uniref:Type I-D CRISPR-associated protein Cas10d/Csc3 n=1 Tax=Microcystis aeruginosa KW TaxID=1960155 RepID=A0A1V4BT31_MICAE|nr:type I-D CRISPR-associated protein Cas10d/Csc3 [Microcystis aeruginosa]OPF17588.1 type I-D CRISPR-associated protein Cas10d/Csc3 [Microcystis aeruginosa KW]
MTRAKKESNKDLQQLNLFDYSDNTEAFLEENEENDNYTSEDNEEELPESNRDEEEIQKEFLTTKLFKEAIIKQNPEDIVMIDFAEYVLPNFLKVAAGVTAKGGKWIENKIAEGNLKSDRALHDQSLSTHILNGLFAANLIEQQIEKLDTTSIKRYIKEFDRRLGMAGFILHDFEKFKYDRFPQMPEKYKKLPEIRGLSIQEHREILDVMIRHLQLDVFIDPENPEGYREYIDDLLVIAYNAQVRWGTNWNFSIHDGLSPKLKPRGDKLFSLTGLACLADRISSIVKHPQDALSSRLDDILGRLSNRNLKLTYHAISENRGVLTNVINNALIDEYVSLNTPEKQYYQPLLYLPTGVVYLTSRNAPEISVDNIPERVVDKINSLCIGELRTRQTGFNRDGKGMKYAEYYHLFFNTLELMDVGLDATLKILKDGKKPVSGDRSGTLVKFQKLGILSDRYNFEFKEDIRIDQIAEFCDLISRKIWDEKVSQILEVCKRDKELPKPSEFDFILEVAKHWDLLSYIPAIREIQRINDSLKERKLKGNTGGLPLEWYYLAAKYLEHNVGIGNEEIKPICQKLLIHLRDSIEPILNDYQVFDGWDDLRAWVKQVVMLPNQQTDTISPDKFFEEFQRYKNSKKSGRGKTALCSISHSAYSVTEQMESAVLFTPQVYTNKQTLGGSNAKRNISSIAGIEFMLRQILMSETEAVGKNFEDAKYRYIYFYPTYYCTPETNAFLHRVYEEIKQTRFDKNTYNHFIRDFQAHLELDQYRSLDIFHLDNTSIKDRSLKLSYPEKQPLTFYFMALPPEVKGKDKKITDTESWIMPAWLGLAFPMILDVKTVVSESPIPPFNDGAEFQETVFLDGAPTALRALVQRDLFRLDYILESWEEEGKKYPAPLNTLTAAYSIHLDVNSKQGKTGYDPNWGKLTELAINLETSPLYVFHYLKQWKRGKDADIPSANRIALYLYDFYPCFDPYVTEVHRSNFTINMEEQSPLNHPKKLTELYRQFYRANKRYNPKANAVLKPIDVAADTILKGGMYQGEALVSVVAAEVASLMNRVHASTAEGRWILSDREQERQKILSFARYFVIDMFEGSFKGDRARLAGRQLNLIRDTCEFLYRLEQDRENQELKAQGQTVEEDSENNN